MIHPVSSQAMGRPTLATVIELALHDRPHSRACEEIQPQIPFVPH